MPDSLTHPVFDELRWEEPITWWLGDFRLESGSLGHIVGGLEDVFGGHCLDVRVDGSLMGHRRWLGWVSIHLRRRLHGFDRFFSGSSSSVSSGLGGGSKICRAGTSSMPNASVTSFGVRLDRASNRA